MGIDKLFITTKDRPRELAILCKSLVHSDIAAHINEVVFLDDNSEQYAEVMRVYSAFMYAMVASGVNTKFIKSRFGTSGINQNLERIQYNRCDRIWILDADFIVFSNYFSRCKEIFIEGRRLFGEKGLLVSGFDTPFHASLGPVRGITKACKKQTISGASNLFTWDNLEGLLYCLRKPNMEIGWDLHLHEVFKNILVTTPSVSQHIGIYSGLNQLGLSGFPGAWATLEG